MFSRSSSVCVIALQAAHIMLPRLLPLLVAGNCHQLHGLILLVGRHLRMPAHWSNSGSLASLLLGLLSGGMHCGTFMKVGSRTSTPHLHFISVMGAPAPSHRKRGSPHSVRPMYSGETTPYTGCTSRWCTKEYAAVCVGSQPDPRAQQDYQRVRLYSVNWGFPQLK